MNKEDLIKSLTESSKTQKLSDVSSSSKWFSNALKRLDKEKTEVKRFTPGNLFAFYYDPKLKEKLPYYDNFPLIILIQKTSDGFIGLNLHYIPPQLRAKLLIALINFGLIVESNTTNDVIRYKLTYNILSTLSIFKFFKPCIKEYKFNHVKSKILIVKSDEWNNVINLPFEQFKKQKKEKIWKESLDQIRGDNKKTRINSQEIETSKEE